jgi:hypothetical protein
LERFFRQGLNIYCASGTSYNIFEMGNDKFEPTFVNEGADSNYWFHRAYKMETVVAWNGQTMTNFFGVKNTTATATFLADIATSTYFYISPWLPAKTIGDTSSVTTETIAGLPYTQSTWIANIYALDDVATFVVDVFAADKNGNRIVPTAVDFLMDGVPNGRPFEGGTPLPKYGGGLSSAKILVTNETADLIQIRLRSLGASSIAPETIRGIELQTKHYNERGEVNFQLRSGQGVGR